MCRKKSYQAVHFAEKLSHLPLISMQVGCVSGVGASAVSCTASTISTSETKARRINVLLLIW